MLSDIDMPSEIPLAKFQTIEFHKLECGDATEKQKVFLAAKQDGFFYLSFENLPERDSLQSVIDGIYALENHLFNISEDEKMEFDVDKQGPMKLNGYD